MFIVVLILGTQQSMAVAYHSPPLEKRMQLDLGGGATISLLQIGPGSFAMGSQATEKGRTVEELLHEVKISRAFHIGICPVTVRQFRAFIDSASYKTEAESGRELTFGRGGHALWRGFERESNWKNVGFKQTDDHPVVNVNWNDAIAFCRWLSRKSGKIVDLPTEAEWEFACRANTKMAYFSGNSEMDLKGNANVADLQLRKVAESERINLGLSFASFDDGYAFTAPVGSFSPNPWGLFDMIGNVYQWCRDWDDEDYYKNSPKVDPPGPVAPGSRGGRVGPGKRRAVRGSSWCTAPLDSRCATRGGAPQDGCLLTLGFRIVVRVSELDSPETAR
jgi:formylglycine-generating enzyme required for sulfatase activity